MPNSPKNEAPNFYMSHRAARFIDAAIEAYCEALSHARWHLDDNGKSDIDNDISFYQAIQRDLRGT